MLARAKTDSFILPYEPDSFFDIEELVRIEEKINEGLTKEEAIYLIKWMNYRVRKLLNCDDPTLKYMCFKATSKLIALLNKLNIEYRSFNLSKIINGAINHYVTELSLGDTKFIVDPTYTQFMILTIGSDYGYYLISTPEGKELARQLLNSGFYELTEENIKLYCDAFINRLNTRQGNKIGYNICSGKEYIEMLSKCDEIKNVKEDVMASLTPKQLKRIR